MLLIASLALAVKPTSAPQKHIGRTLPMQETVHPRPNPLDQIYTSTDVPRDIPDGPGGIATSVLNIPDGTTITDLNIMVSINHTWIRDLRISLIAPNNVEVVLLRLFPGDSIVNMADCWFDDEAGTLIDSGVPPFTGYYRPQNPLTAFDSLSAQGTWTLRVEDEFLLDVGQIVGWAIDVNPSLSLSGRVTNSLTGNGVAQVQVEAIAADTFSAITSYSGDYGYVHLPPGTYALRCFKADYDTFAVGGIEIVEGVQHTENVSLIPVADYYEYASTAERVFIADTSYASMSFSVESDAIITDLDVTINVTHTYDGDLDLFLISPDPDTIQLFSGLGQSGDHFIYTRFDDQAETNIDDGIPPFTGRFHPFENLVSFTNDSAAGTWTLLARDGAPDDEGFIENFTLHIYTGLSTDDPFVPYSSSLILSAFPNPFNAATQFQFDLPRAAPVELVLFDVIGRRVASVLNETRAAGTHTVLFDASALPSGIYFARLSTPAQTVSTKILLLK